MDVYHREAWHLAEVHKAATHTVDSLAFHTLMV